MGNGLQIAGLIVSTVGAAWLSGFDIRERSKRSERTQEMARLKNRMDALQKAVRAVSGMLAEANRRLDERGEAPAPAINVADRIAPYLKEIAELQTKIDKMEDPNAKVLEDLVPVSHPIAFGLMAVGFILEALSLMQ